MTKISVLDRCTKIFVLLEIKKKAIGNHGCYICFLKNFQKSLFRNIFANLGNQSSIRSRGPSQNIVYSKKGIMCSNTVPQANFFFFSLTQISLWVCHSHAAVVQRKHSETSLNLQWNLYETSSGNKMKLTNATADQLVPLHFISNLFHFTSQELVAIAVWKWFVTPIAIFLSVSHSDMA